MVTRTVIHVTSLAATESEEADSIIENASNANTHSPKGDDNKNGGGKKRDLPSGDAAGGKVIKKRQRTDDFVLDLSDVQPQQPIPKSKGYMKEGASKYMGVSFRKAANKWHAAIDIEGKTRHIGYYENEEEAAIDYARALFKYKGERDSNGPESIHLSDVPPQQPIPKSKGRIKEGASKYVGVSKSKNKWIAVITIDGKQRRIGYYMNEEEAAVDFARAVLKYKGEEALAKIRERKSSGSGPAINIDLSDAPPQLPIPKCKGHIKEGASKYAGVTFNKTMNKWHAQIMIEGKQSYIGCYENEEEAGADYARAVFKYKGREALDKARGPKKSKARVRKQATDSIKNPTSTKKSTNSITNKNGINSREVKKRQKAGTSVLDLTDVPPQLPIPKSEHHIKEGSSKYTGVYFEKARNKWQAQIRIDGKNRTIGYYQNEEEAAIDYARAVFKYKGPGALNNLRKRNSSTILIDLSDVPPQQPIPKSKRRIKEGSSKYTGVYFNKQMNKWLAQITIEGKQHHIGLYVNDEEAAVDYARAVFKYKGKRH